MSALLEMRGLTTTFPIGGADVPIVDGIDLDGRRRVGGQPCLEIALGDEPVGLAALRGGIKTVLIPEDNAFFYAKDIDLMCIANKLGYLHCKEIGHIKYIITGNQFIHQAMLSLRDNIIVFFVNL